MNVENSDRNKETWGYVVCFGTVITFVACIGHINSFGLIYKDFIQETNSSAKSITIAHGVFALMLAVGGLFLNIMSRYNLLRLGGFIGAIVFITGSLSNVIISSTNQLPLTFGLLQGLGFGMMVPVCYSTVNFYFVKRRTQVMSVIKAVQGAILIWYPQLLKVLIISYGFRGSLLIIAGISLHTIPGMISMRTKDESRKKHIAIKDLADRENGENDDLLRNKENVTALERPTKDSTSNKIVRTVFDILNVKVLKDFIYCNICIGQSFVNFSDLKFFILQPMLLQQYGYEMNQVAMCISICAGADVAGRFGLAVLSGMFDVKPRTLYYTATLLTFVSRLVLWTSKDDSYLLFVTVFISVREYIWVAVITAILGLLRAILHVTSPVVISNYVAHEDFTGAYALFLLTTGVIDLLLSPIIGTLKDIYEDYVPTFYALAVCCVPCLILWPLEYIIRR